MVGLNGTGDRLATSIFTRQTLIGMLERLGVNTRDNEAKLATKNVAAVMVTANLPAFARPGSRIDIAVSALGDATNLQGGTLLVTPLLGADGEVYAVAQGAVATGAVAARGAGASVMRGVPTSARIASGAIVEREVPYALTGRPSLRLALRNPDLTTARRIAAAINRATGGSLAAATDPRTVALNMAGRDPIALLGEIEQLRVEPDQVARVVIEEASGTIVMGANVRVSTVAVAQGNLTIRITETPQVSQPNALLERPDHGGAAHGDRGGRPGGAADGRAGRGRHAAGVGARDECARGRATRPDLDPAGGEGGRRAAGRDGAQVMDGLQRLRSDFARQRRATRQAGWSQVMDGPQRPRLGFVRLRRAERHLSFARLRRATRQAAMELR